MKSLKAALRPIVERALSRYGVILSGAGRGMRFDPTGGNLSYIRGAIIPYEEAALVRYLAPGSVYYDIGANIGFYVVIGARLVGPTGHVYAFEPFAKSVEAIRRNCRINGLSNVTVEQRAVGEKRGTMRLELTELPEMHRLGQATADAAGEEVPVVSVDEYVFEEKKRAPSVVMIDVEGAEFSVLRGMLRTMQEFRPVVLCEIHWLTDPMNEFCRTYLPDLNYTVKRLDREGDLPQEPIWYHALFMPSEKAAVG